MSRKLIIVETQAGIQEFSKKLKSLTKEHGFDTLTTYSYDKFKEDGLASLKYNERVKNYQFVFLGLGTSSNTDIPRITSWEYDEFGCRIGFTDNKCVISVYNSNFNREKHDAFRKHCEILSHENDAILVPHEYAEIQGAQYAMVFHEFAKRWLEKFMKGELNEAFKDNTMPITETTVEDIKDMSKKAKKVVVGAAASAAALAAVPIPFADAPMLVSAQVAMMASIAKIFKIEVKNSLKPLVVGAVSVGGAVALGRAALSNLAKFIPGKGSVVGAIIAAPIASTLTTAMGMVFIDICKDVRRGKLDAEIFSSQEGSKIFKEKVKDFMKSNKNVDLSK
ncbi:MAG: DUF697 domain-containing protein [Defluviitaleaceae bacterium]|nr:DUF697 domain-containing protein [Defluviitaleaceae bacterium]